MAEPSPLGHFIGLGGREELVPKSSRDGGLKGLQGRVAPGKRFRLELSVSQQQVVSPERLLLAKPLVPKSVLRGEGEQTKATGLPVWEMMGSRPRDMPLPFFGLYASSLKVYAGAPDFLLPFAQPSTLPPVL